MPSLAQINDRTPEDRVVDRLAVVRALIDQKKPLAEPKRIGIFPDGTATSKWDQHDSLINYLLLTCFDVLGQTAPFIQFGDWLSDTSLEGERQEALAPTINAALPPVKLAQALLAWYNRKYSVTRGFFRFIDELITDEAREELLGSVHIGCVFRCIRSAVPGASDQDSGHPIRYRSEATSTGLVRRRVGSRAGVSDLSGGAWMSRAG